MIPILEDIIRGLLDGTMSPEDARKWLKAHEDLRREREAGEPTDAEMREDIAKLLGDEFNEQLFEMHRNDDTAGIVIYVMRRFMELGT